MMNPHADQLTASGSVVEVVGQPAGRALQVAAAGAHHLAITSPPGTATTTLVPWLASLLPDLDNAAALEATALHTLAGILPPGSPPLHRPPVQAPGYRISTAELVGSGLARPGVLSLAHRGVLVLEQAPRFSPQTWHVLCQALDLGQITLHRAGMVTDLPARTQLITTATPCPCTTPAGGLAHSPPQRHHCPWRLAGPLLDRIDIHLPLNQPSDTCLNDEPTTVMADRVATARAAAVARWAAHGWRSNAEVPAMALRAHKWRLPASVIAPVHRLIDTGRLSARGHDQVLRIAWTVADLAGHALPDHDDVNEAIQLRTWYSAPDDVHAPPRQG